MLGPLGSVNMKNSPTMRPANRLYSSKALVKLQFWSLRRHPITVPESSIRNAATLNKAEKKNDDFINNQNAKQ